MASFIVLLGRDRQNKNLSCTFKIAAWISEHIKLEGEVQTDGGIVMACIPYLQPCVLFVVEWYHWKEAPS